MLHRVRQDRAMVSEPAPIILGRHSEPEPDIAVLRPAADFYKSRHPGPAHVLLVVEVADTTVAFDRRTKLPLYARHAIPEAWLADLPAAVLKIHRDPEEGAYTRVKRPAPGDLGNVPIPGLPDVPVDLTGLL